MEKMNNRCVRLSIFCCALYVLGAAEFNSDLQAATPTSSPDSNVQNLSKLSVEELMDVPVFDETVTSVSKQKSDIRRSAAAVFVITQEMIRRSGATVIPELFRVVPGMNVARIDGNKWAIGVRGFNNRFQDKLLVQVDGRSIYNPLFSGVYWDNVDYPLEDIERIEVIRGPGASVWGANAVNGVINIITKKAQDTHGGLLTGGGGNEEQGFGTLRYGDQVGKNFHYRIYSKGFKRDKQYSNEGSPYDGWWGTNAGVKGAWQVSENDEVTFDNAYLLSNAERDDIRPQVTAPFRLPNLENEKTNHLHLLTNWTHTVSSDSNWALKAYWDRNDRKGSHGFVDLRWDTLDLDFQHELPEFYRQKVIYGLGYRYINAFLGPSTQDGGFAVSFPPKDHRNSQLLSAFLQDQVNLVEDRLTATLGAKIEHNSFTGVEIQPTGRLIWTPTEKQSIWGAFSRAVRTPNLSENGIGTKLLPASTTAPAVFPVLTANTELRSEELLSYELGYRMQVSQKVEVDTALFYNIYRDLRVTVPGTVQPGPAAGTLLLPLTFRNGMDGDLYGAEASANWKMLSWWRFYGAYTFLKEKLKRDGDIAATAEAAEEQSPQHQVYLQSSWDLPHDVEVDLMSRYVTRLRGFNLSNVAGVADVIPAYMSLDLRVSWKPLKNLELSVVGQNLWAPQHAEFGTGSSLRAPVVQIERSVYGKVTVEWGEK